MNVLTAIAGQFSAVDWSSLVGFDPTSPVIFTRFYFWGFFTVVMAVLALLYRSHPFRVPCNPNAAKY